MSTRLIRLSVLVFVMAFVMAVPCVQALAEPGDKDGLQWSSPYERVIAESDFGVGLMGGYGVEIGDPPELDFAQVMPFVSFPLAGATGSGFYRGVPEYKVEAFIGYVDNWNHHGIFGLSPVGFRYNFTGLGGRLVPFIEGELGAAYVNIPKSIQGTRFSFTESGGVGLRLFVSDGAAVEVSGRFRHLSNAGIRKPNPGINTLFVLVGISYY